MIALNRAGVQVKEYFASEIDKHAIKASKENWPEIQHIGDVTKVRIPKGEKIDLLVAGSPCQGFSFAGKQLNFDDPRSRLFFEFVRVLRECRRYNPNIKFMLENVVMKKQYQDIISEYLGCQPIFINSKLVSGQDRKRLYWTNIPIAHLPEDKGILFSHVVDSSWCGSMRGRRINDRGVRDDYNMEIPIVQRIEAREDNKSNCLTTVEKDNVVIERHNSDLIPGKDFRYLALHEIERAIKKHSAQTWKSGNRMGSVKFPTPTTGKSKCVVATQIIGDRASNHVQDLFGIRMLTPEECEMLQTIPVGYTSMIPKSQRIKAIGNAWTVDVVAHIFSFL
jgi:site-specific DNA-cytosine methylase